MELKNLKNLRQLKAALKDATVQDIEDIIQKLKQVKEDFILAEKERIESEKVRNDSINSMLGKLDELNITIDDLVAARGLKKEPKQKRVVPPKYRYTDLNGVERTWTGQGKLPTALKELMELEEHDKEFYRIKK